MRCRSIRHNETNTNISVVVGIYLVISMKIQVTARFINSIDTCRSIGGGKRFFHFRRTGKSNRHIGCNIRYRNGTNASCLVKRLFQRSRTGLGYFLDIVVVGHRYRLDGQYPIGNGVAEGYVGQCTRKGHVIAHIDGDVAGGVVTPVTDLDIGKCQRTAIERERVVVAIALL